MLHTYASSKDMNDTPDSSKQLPLLKAKMATDIPHL